MDDEGNTKHTLLFVVWHLHALHKLGHRPGGDRQKTISQVCVGERVAHAFIIYPCPVDAGQQDFPSGDHKKRAGLII